MDVDTDDTREDWQAEDINAIRTNALLAATASIVNMAKSTQQEAIDNLSPEKLDHFLSLFDTDSPHPICLTLFLGIAVAFSNSVCTPSLQDSKQVIPNGDFLLNQMKHYDTQKTSRATYDTLRTYFPDENSDTPHVFPHFKPDSIQKMEEVVVNLYDWLDATFTILQVKFE